MTKKFLVSSWVTDPVITDHDWEELEAAANTSFAPEHRGEIKAAIVHYNESASVYRGSPRLSEIRPGIEEIAKRAKQLVAAIDRRFGDRKLGRATRKAIELESLRDRKEYPLDPTLKTIRLFSRDAAATAKRCSIDDIGGKGDPHLGPLLLRLLKVYLLSGGKGIYSESSKKFLFAASRIAGASINSEEALVKRLNRARKPGTQPPSF
jgi:hypothetical protein